MTILSVLRALGPIDFKNVRRDSMLSWLIILPLLTALIMRWGVPALTRSLLADTGFDLTPYYPVIVAYFFIVMLPIISAVLIGFLLLDEKDDNTLIALQVTPLPLAAYISYRIALPMLLTIIQMFIIFPLAGLTPFDLRLVLISALAAAPMSPMFALFIASFAENKVQGFALMKLAGFLLFVPTFAFFVKPGWDYAFGIIPTFWPMKAYWMLESGETGALAVTLVAVVYQLALTALFTRRFFKVLHR